jgi:hypothetical protein
VRQSVQPAISAGSSVIAMRSRCEQIGVIGSMLLRGVPLQILVFECLLPMEE